MRSSLLVVTSLAAGMFLAIFAALVAYDAVAGDGHMGGMWDMMDGGMMGGDMHGMMGGGGPQTTGSASGEGDVRIVDFSFQPTALAVTPGTVITWTNDDSAPHTATGDDFDTGRLNQADSGSVTFDIPGIYEYICTYHPSMTGRVTVSEVVP